jgi:SulP family sulfate permease
VAAGVILFGIDVPLVGDLASIEGGLPQWHVPMVPINLETLKIIFPYALILAAIGLIESLLTLNLVGEITGRRGGASQECIAQGAANTVTGFFGGMGGCAMIGQSMININSGGRGRLSGITAALVLLAFILFAAPLIEKIPLAALVGVMFIVVIGTFEWASFRILRGVNKEDAVVLISVTGITVIADLAIAVVVGVIMSALVFAWKHATHIHAKTHTDNDGWKVYEMEGPLFFGSVLHFKDLFDPKEDPQDVVIDFNESRIWDSSGLDALDNLADKYQEQGKTLHIRHISEECRNLMKKADKYVEMNVNEDPRYHVATDALDN